MRICDLDTPSLLLDKDIFDQNLRLMCERARAAGKLLRPHAKTHKCSRIAKEQLAAGQCAGVCAAKVSEALALLRAGIPSVLITSPVVGKLKIDNLCACLATGAECLVVVDNYDNAVALSAAADACGRTLPVLLDIDPEMGRTGVAFAEAPALAHRIAALEHLHLRGLQCYAGHLQHLPDRTQRQAESQRLMRQAAQIYRSLQSDGLQLDIFTGTGTGTAAADLEIAEITDLQVGSYCVLDAEYAAVEDPRNLAFEDFRPALTLLTSVISANLAGQVTVDAGLKALYYTPAAPPRVVSAAQPLPGWRYDWFGDEQGRLFFSGQKAPALGEYFELCLPHCDPTINLHDSIQVHQQGRVIERWPVDLRGLGQ